MACGNSDVISVVTLENGARDVFPRPVISVNFVSMAYRCASLACLFSTVQLCSRIICNNPYLTKYCLYYIRPPTSICFTICHEQDFITNIDLIATTGMLAPQKAILSGERHTVILMNWHGPRVSSSNSSTFCVGVPFTHRYLSPI